MAEGIFRRMLHERRLEAEFEVDSCGTGGWHTGESADPRTRWILAKENADFLHQARKIAPEDMSYYEHIWVMDRDNLRDLERVFPQHTGKARLVMNLSGLNGADVPDPYYGDLADFEKVYALLEQALEAFFAAHQKS